MNHLEHAENSAVKILGFCGSLRSNGFTRHAVRIALEGARETGADVELVDFAQLALPFCTGSDEVQAAHPGVIQLRKMVQEAHGAIWGTPEYHGSFSGVLKNALDLTDLDDWRGKVVGLVGVSGGSTGPTSAINALRDVGRGLDAWVLPRQVAIAAPHKVFDAAGEPLAADLRERLLKLGRETARFARVHAPHKH